jgi:hypothetical protein
MTATPCPDQDPLIEQLRSQRAQLDRFLRRTLPQRRQLVNASILCSSLAALITAAPAFGGQAFTTGLTETLNLAVPSWRLLCGLASVASVVASVATQVLQTSRLEEKVSGGWHWGSSIAGRSPKPCWLASKPPPCWPPARSGRRAAWPAAGKFKPASPHTNPGWPSACPSSRANGSKGAAARGLWHPQPRSWPPGACCWPW